MADLGPTFCRGQIFRVLELKHWDEIESVKSSFWLKPWTYFILKQWIFTFKPAENSMTQLKVFGKNNFEILEKWKYDLKNCILNYVKLK